MTGDVSIKTLADRIEAIESGYEFLLAYAAQGRETDRGGGSGQDIRKFLEDMDTAMEGLGRACKTLALEKDPDAVDGYMAFLDAVENDALRAQGAVRLVMAQEDISSQLVDNLNASVHLRTLLTDLFIIDDALKPGR